MAYGKNNNAEIVGNLTQEIQVKNSQYGTMAFFTIAHNRYNKGNKTGTDFIPCVAYNEVCDKLAGLSKGTMVKVCGELITNENNYYKSDNGKPATFLQLRVEDVSLPVKGTNRSQNGENSGFVNSRPNDYSGYQSDYRGDSFQGGYPNNSQYNGYNNGRNSMESMNQHQNNWNGGRYENTDSTGSGFSGNGGIPFR